MFLRPLLLLLLTIVFVAVAKPTILMEARSDNSATEPTVLTEASLDNSATESPEGPVEPADDESSEASSQDDSETESPEGPVEPADDESSEASSQDDSATEPTELTEAPQEEPAAPTMADKLNVRSHHTFIQLSHFTEDIVLLQFTGSAQIEGIE